ncbi:MAG: RDD family protein [Acidobacteria bacterium]|nr:MAG: RDD family protein [Acidobacteriota bacterium]REK02757.1 MAG: RDD family protein [Acidobacteriota bacterium]REK13438.1 MAG: RDD family protein [Acidobacteriota bacterium]REK41432.1 MAG: RDD family protein [Acidobacteriota bacterium]
MQSLIETEESLIIETPERVPLSFALASIGNRFLAVAIDHAIQYFVLFTVGYAIYSLTGLVGNEYYAGYYLSELPKWSIAILLLLLSMVFSGYFVFFEWLWSGQTPGKKLMKLRVIRDDGRPITLWESFARNLLRIFDAMPVVALPMYSIGLITVFISGRDQRVGDLFAGTVVIRERSDEAPTFEETFSSSRITDTAMRRVFNPRPFEADLSELTTEEMEVVEMYLRRRFDLSERQRLWMAWRVALPIMFKIRPVYEKDDFHYEAFLEELYHRWSARARFLD